MGSYAVAVIMESEGVGIVLFKNEVVIFIIGIVDSFGGGGF